MSAKHEVEFKLCQGSDCRKRKKRYEKLRATFADVVELRAVKCQDICKAPVVVICRDGERFWFKKMDDKKARTELMAFVQGGELTSFLTKRLVKRRPRKKKGHRKRAKALT